MIATGYFSCTTDFNPVGTGGVISATPGIEDIFLVKYNNQGQFQWVKSMGEAQRDIGYAVDCDEKGQIYLTGHFQGVIDLDTGLSSASYSSVGLEDAFVAKYDTNRAYVWSFQLGGTEREYGHGDQFHIAGSLRSLNIDFDPDSSTTALSSAEPYPLTSVVIVETRARITPLTFIKQ